MGPVKRLRTREYARDKERWRKTERADQWC